MKQNISLLLSLACCLLGSSFHSLPVTAQQVIPDGTTSTQVNVDDKNFEINQGDRVGDNLFHLNGLPSETSSSVNQEAVGNAGGITINTGFLSLTNGGRVIADTLGEGNAGDVTVDASESIFISGATKTESFRSGISADAFISSGDGGDVNVSTNQLTIDDGGTIEAGNFDNVDSLDKFSPGTGQPGNINIEANSLNLSNQARIEAATQSEEGEAANINLNIAEDITLQNNSFISARALEKADGGNLDIDARFIVAFPNQNNDIIANADEGDGGRININVNSLFGIEERSLNDLTNDLNASSEFGLDGDISINTPDVDPLRGLDNLPGDMIEASTEMVSSCLTAEEEKYNKFILTGRGGIPSNPEETVRGDATLPAQWLTLPDTTQESEEIEPEKPQSQESTPEIVEAKGWMINAEGNVVLTATANDNTPIIVPWLIPPNCDSLPK